MGKQTPQAPAAPDPVALSNAQGAANKETAITQARLGAVNSTSPFGSVSYTETPNQYDPSTPSFTQTTTLSPEQQQLYNTQQGITQKAYDTAGQAIGNVQNTLSSPFSLFGLPNLSTGVNGGPIQGQVGSAKDFSAQGQQVQDAVMQRFNQDIGRRQEDVESRLNAQGIQRGSAAFANAQDDLSRARNDALGQAVMLGNQEQGRLFGQQLSAGQFGNAAQQQGFNQAQANSAMQNQARQQSISEQQLMRSQPINEIATLLGLGSGIQVPTGAPNFGVNVGQTDVMGAYGMQQQALQNQYNQQMQANNAMWGGLSNLGGAAASAFMLSDRRTKNIIRKVGETATGVPLFLYSYKHAPDREVVGVMAQDVRKVNPMAVYDMGGILVVDYAEVA